MRGRARELFDIGVRAALPGPALHRALDAHPLPTGPVHLMAVGKAAPGMALAALDRLPGPPKSALVVTTAGSAVPVPGARVLIAGHPVPDAAGVAAAAAVEAQLDAVAPGDTVLALISGGGSALLPAPVAGLSLEDKAEVSRLMLATELDITQMNLVRQALSRLKGGGMLRRAPLARFLSYVLSDVIGDDLRAVASGPTVAPIGTRAEAAALLRDAALWDALPARVQAHLDAPERPVGPLPQSEAYLIGSNRMSLDAMKAAAPAARIVSGPTDRPGDARRREDRRCRSPRQARRGAVVRRRDHGAGQRRRPGGAQSGTGPSRRASRPRTAVRLDACCPAAPMAATDRPMPPAAWSTTTRGGGCAATGSMPSRRWRGPTVSTRFRPRATC